MIPDPTLTDEELAEMEVRHRLNPALYGRGDRCSWCFSGWPCETARLIAALRASREEASVAVDVPPDVQERFDDFWRDIVMPDGRWDFGQVMRELHDYSDLLGEVPKVYAEVTGGIISKPHTLASEVLRVHDERCHVYCSDELAEP